VLFDLDEAAKSIFHRVFVDLQRLEDDDAPFHLALDHVDFSVPSALQRRFQDNHFVHDVPN